MNFTVFFSLLIIGLVAGIFSGLLGVGGSLVMIPLMVLLLNFNQYEAQGTSLAVLSIPVTFFAAYNYYQEGYVNWKFAIIIAVSFVLGGYLGSKFAISINQTLLKKIFSMVLILAAIKIYFGK
ncbi:MAG: sulfite exporter TauE/SafE family protein [Flavobacteriales bacterium]